MIVSSTSMGKTVERVREIARHMQGTFLFSALCILFDGQDLERERAVKRCTQINIPLNQKPFTQIHAHHAAVECIAYNMRYAIFIHSFILQIIIMYTQLINAINSFRVPF